MEKLPGGMAKAVQRLGTGNMQTNKKTMMSDPVKVLRIHPSI
jgi:hypothetical protein